MSATSSGTPPPPPPRPAAVLAQRYRLERRLAQGGMAEVWLGTDLMLNRQVAVKLLKPALATDPVVAERFRREAIAVAQLSHPNIVAVYDSVEDVVEGHRRQAVVMQLISGKSLRQLLDEQKRLSPELTMHIGSCVAAALDAAHHANMVHRDVKPGNILITPDGRVLLTDFGIAKGLADADDLTSDHVMMGTAKYLSPEQVRGYKLDGRADLYSLGLVLYECLAGRVPFLGETDADTALARLNRDPTGLDVLRPTLPRGLVQLVHRLLQRKPADRPASGAEVRNALNAITQQPRPKPKPAAPPVTPPAPRRLSSTTHRAAPADAHRSVRRPNRWLHTRSWRASGGCSDPRRSHADRSVTSQAAAEPPVRAAPLTIAADRRRSAVRCVHRRLDPVGDARRGRSGKAVYSPIELVPDHPELGGRHALGGDDRDPVRP